MSRIGKRILTIPEKVNVELVENKLTVKGPKGELSLDIDPNIKVKVEENKITVEKAKSIKAAEQMHGTTNALIQNMLIGVSEGYHKNIEINGVGYRFNVAGKTLTINAGFSHPVKKDIPEGITINTISNTEIELVSIDKQKLGQFAAEVRAIRPPEPYKGKGIKYKDETIRRKVGKTASK